MKSLSIASPPPRISCSKAESVYLSDEEIERIYALDLSCTGRLDNAKDFAIVDLRIGLRVSDFLKLETKNIREGYIEVQIQKIGVIIPLHLKIKAVLEKRGGLPEQDI